MITKTKTNDLSIVANQTPQKDYLIDKTRENHHRNWTQLKTKKSDLFQLLFGFHHHFTPDMREKTP